jgi:Zn ribbon nucleic-acid-binding protein
MVKFFRIKRSKPDSKRSGPNCPRCESSNTMLVVYPGTESNGRIKVWRGQRSALYRCFNCGSDFYGDERPDGIEKVVMENDTIIDDAQALSDAEEELKREIEEDDDRTCR